LLIPEKTSTSHRVDAICFRKHPIRTPLNRLRRNRNGFASKDGFHGINESADVHRSPQRSSFIEQPIDLFALRLKLRIM
jgi:hypothetical protein